MEIKTVILVSDIGLEDGNREKRAVTRKPGY